MNEHPLMNSLANEFASTFTLLEYAIKAAGFCKPKNGSVETDWKRFAENSPNINEELFYKLKAHKIAKYIIEEPPKIRVIKNGSGLDWKEPPKVTSMRALWEAVKRVRNNLFHGDKANPNPTRDGKLMQAGLAVIDAILSEAANSVQGHFHQGIMFAPKTKARP